MIRITGTSAGKNILLLQGPNGTFFRHLDNYFRQNGARTFRICFNAGDRFYANKDNVIDFKGAPDAWPDFIRRTIGDLKIHSIFLFGDCRRYHREAIEAATELSVESFVFEEGYLRPDFVTLEKSGANAHSSLPRGRDFYEALELGALPESISLPAETSTAALYRQTIFYYLLNSLLRFQYPHYRHHRGAPSRTEAFYGLRGCLRKLRTRVSEHRYNHKLQYKWPQDYYFVPLQTYNDAQLRVHSAFDSIEAFIETVLESFARHAPASSKLVFKHHPHPVDRGAKEYTRLIKKRARSLNTAKRVFSLHDVHLPTCLKNARGTVTINSTVGLSSLFHKTPTITLGEAVYDIEGLTCKGMSLDAFWSNARRPDPVLYQKFRRYLIQKTQLNGSFYGRFPSEIEPAEQKVIRLAPTPATAEYRPEPSGSMVQAWQEQVSLTLHK